MKIIEDNFKMNNICERYICEHCNSVFEYDDKDIYSDTDNVEYVLCPCCGLKCITYTPPTPKTIEYPKDFYQFGGDNKKSVDISNEEITTKIRECIAWLEENPDEPFRYMGYGNMFICVFNHEDEYYIIVTKNYFETSIDN